MTTLKGKPDTRTDATIDGGAKEFGGTKGCYCVTLYFYSRGPKGCYCIAKDLD